MHLKHLHCRRVVVGRVLFLAMGSMPQMALTLQQKSVFYKQRGNNFFQPSIWAVSMVRPAPYPFHACTRPQAVRA